MTMTKWRTGDPEPEWLREPVPEDEGGTPRAPRRWVTAKYSGRCGSCGYPVEPGDPIHPDADKGWVCENCA